MTGFFHNTHLQRHVFDLLQVFVRRGQHQVANPVFRLRQDVFQQRFILAVYRLRTGMSGFAAKANLIREAIRLYLQELTTNLVPTALS